MAAKTTKKTRKRKRRRANARPRPAPTLTQRELEVMELLARGLSYPLIANTLAIQLGTVQTHIKKIYRKLEIGTKAEATAEAIRRGIIE
jgi:DNA-binding CsgD family transcriptional regulator